MKTNRVLILEMTLWSYLYQLVQGTDYYQTVRLEGQLANQSVEILLDSGSSSSFVSSTVVAIYLIGSFFLSL